MNKKSKHSNIKDYLRTIGFSFLGVCICVVLFSMYMIHDVYKIDEKETPKLKTEAEFQAYLVDMLIDKNTYLAELHPKNYVANLKLGILYSYKKDYKKSEEQFKYAIAKAPSNNYIPTYRLANLYISMNRLQEAQSLMDNLGEKPNKRLIEYKAQIYKKLGERFYQQGYLVLSIQKYEKALFYMKKIKSKDIENTKDLIVSASIALADRYVDCLKIEEAIDTLENAYSIKYNPFLEYKLGLLLIDNDPMKAYRLLSKVIEKTPNKVDFDVYYNLLKKIAQEQIDIGNKTDGALYYAKAKQYKKFVKDNILYNKDLFINIINSSISINENKKEYLMNLQFKMQNNSVHDIDNLTIDIIFKDQNQVIQSFTQKIFDKGRVFTAGTITPSIDINAAESFKDQQKSPIINVQIFAYKYPKYRIKLIDYNFIKPEHK